MSIGTPSAIPPIEFNQLLQIKSSPATIVALLNEKERWYQSLRKTPHGNSKRVYPFWKMCLVCFKPYPCRTKEQATRNKTCSRTCQMLRVSQPRPYTRKALTQGKVTIIRCPVCKKRCPKRNCWLKKVKIPTCSNKCNGVLRGAEWKQHAHKGRAAWTPEAEQSCREKMMGEKNPAWKGGVTYFRSHGNYKGVKYVRCPQEFQVMARKDGYVMEHRLIVARLIGRPLTRVEVVHHDTHNPQNNDPTTLMLFRNNSDHKRFERHGTPEPIWRGSLHFTIAA